MTLSIEISTPKIWYRESTHQWIVSVVFKSRDVSESINFAASTKNKAKKSFYRYCTRDDILGMEMENRFKNQEIHFIDES